MKKLLSGTADDEIYAEDEDPEERREPRPPSVPTSQPIKPFRPLQQIPAAHSRVPFLSVLKKYQMKARMKRLKANVVSPWKPPAPAGPPREKQNGPIRQRKSPASVFSIDNYVIPAGMATPVTVVKKEVKEILTPSWRFVVVNNKNPVAPDGNSSGEDTSDEAFKRRHLAMEEKERRIVAEAIAAARRNRRRSASAADKNTSGEHLTPTPYTSASTGSPAKRKKSSSSPAVTFADRPRQMNFDDSVSSSLREEAQVAISFGDMDSESVSSSCLTPGRLDTHDDAPVPSHKKIRG